MNRRQVKKLLKQLGGRSFVVDGMVFPDNGFHDVFSTIVSRDVVYERVGNTIKVSLPTLPKGWRSMKMTAQLRYIM